MKKNKNDIIVMAKGNPKNFQQLKAWITDLRHPGKSRAYFYSSLSRSKRTVVVAYDNL